MTARRFLAPQARQGNGHGYLTEPDRPYPQASDPPELTARIHARTCLCDEPEAPSPHWLNSEIELAALRNRLRHLRQVEEAVQARQHISIQHRMIDARRRAKHQHVDITMDLYQVRKMLGRGNPVASRQRLEQLEARLDGV